MTGKPVNGYVRFMGPADESGRVGNLPAAGFLFRAKAGDPPALG